ncbi:hypothetical protein Acor_44770 [Acrocarpospora corrugata]|uniref:CHAT domain-containing protein n=2 Tax=Acrocarpospora corrugata TaxID=35763 RepID=A0A5M3W5G9_9ACTN|nr:hypothetical protein Acor_44770 [Acrocarpospora corrugata]
MWLGSRSLGRSVADRPLSSRLVRLAEQGLTLLRDEDGDEVRAWLQIILGQALSSADEGNRVINLERAIGILVRVARAVSRQERPEGWAVAQFEAGRVYEMRDIGDRWANQELAMRYFRAALEEATPDRDPTLFGRAQTALAKVLMERGTQLGREPVEEGIALLEQVVARLDPAGFKELWCDAQSALAGAYNVREAGDPAVNLERALRIYRRIDAVESAETDPEQWANTQVRLGVLLMKRSRGDRLDNHRLAREHFTGALEVYLRVGDRDEASSTYDKLSIVAGTFGEHEEQLRLLRAALADRSRQGAPHLWARTALKLGAVLLDHPEAADSGDLLATRRQGLQLVEDGVAAYEDVVTVGEHGMALYRLAVARRRMREWDPAVSRTDEIAALEAAVAKLRGRFDMLVTVAADLGDALAERGEWARAAQAYELAVAAADELFRACLVSTSRRRRLTFTGNLHQRAAYALARAGRPGDAVLCLEQGRTRTFNEALSPDQDQLRQVARTDPEIHAAYLRAAEAAQDLAARNRELGRFTSAVDGGRAVDSAEYTLGEQVERVRAELADAIAGVRALPGMNAFLREVTMADVTMATRPEEPVVYLAATPSGSVGLIVRHPDDQGPPLDVVWAPLTSERAEAAAREIAEVGRTNGRGLRALLTLLGDELVGPLADRLGPAEALGGDLGGDLGGALGGDSGGGLGGSLAEGPVAGLVVVACGALAHLPLHAATLPGTGEPLAGTHAVAYAPSVRLLLAARRRAEATQPPPVLVAAYDTGQGGGILAEPEATALLGVFGGGRRVTGGLLGELPSGTHIHLACHGGYVPEDPLASGLDLHGGRITLADLLDARPRPLERARLVTLSACETAMIDAGLPDEVVGLPAGILLAGGAGVVCTQWEARDSAAVLLMIAFYRRLLGSGAPARSLRAAQAWLRSATVADILAEEWLPAELRRRLAAPGVPERPFRHPYMWAPFVLVGV